MTRFSLSNSNSNLLSWINKHYAINERDSTIRRELTAGITTFIAMVYTVIVIPNMLANVGFEQSSVFIATCLVAAFGSLIMGLWANLPLAIGCAISLTAFTAYSLVIGQGVSINVALGAVFIMGVLFTLITLLGIRQKILASLPHGIAQGTGAGIGLFLLLIAAKSVGLVIQNPNQGLPVALGDITSLPVMMSIIGLAIIIGLDRRKVPGAILITILAIALFGLAFDENVSYVGIFAIPSFSAEHTLLFDFDIRGALNIAILPVILALVMTSVFDTTLTIRAVAAQANLLDENGHIINGRKALSCDSLSSVIAGMVGGTPASVYIESAAGVAAGGKTGLTATVVGLLFLVTLFFAPIVYLVPAYATAPALMYVGLLMLQNLRHLNFNDPIDTYSGLICAVFIVLTSNIVTGIMLGFVCLVIARVCAGEYKKLNIGTVIIALTLATFYFGGWAI